MSDRAPAIPPAAVDITGYRRAVESVSDVPPVGTAWRIGWLVVVVVLIVSATIAAFALPVNRPLLAGALISALVVLIFVVMLPAKRAADEGRRTLAAADSALEGAVGAVVGRMASIGYDIPREIAEQWLTSPEPSATVPLVHDSVIAARWWRLAEEDDRVFVEAYLRQDGTASALPALRPLA